MGRGRIAGERPKAAAGRRVGVCREGRDRGIDRRDRERAGDIGSVGHIRDIRDIRDIRGIGLGEGRSCAHRGGVHAVRNKLGEGIDVRLDALVLHTVLAKNVLKGLRDIARIGDAGSETRSNAGIHIFGQIVQL